VQLGTGFIWIYARCQGGALALVGGSDGFVVTSFFLLEKKTTSCGGGWPRSLEEWPGLMLWPISFLLELLDDKTHRKLSFQREVEWLSGNGCSEALAGGARTIFALGWSKGGIFSALRPRRPRGLSVRLCNVFILLRKIEGSANLIFSAPRGPRGSGEGTNQRPMDFGTLPSAGVLGKKPARRSFR